MCVCMCVCVYLTENYGQNNVSQADAIHTGVHNYAEICNCMGIIVRVVCVLCIVCVYGVNKVKYY